MASTRASLWRALGIVSEYVADAESHNSVGTPRPSPLVRLMVTRRSGFMGLFQSDALKIVGTQPEHDMSHASFLSLIGLVMVGARHVLAQPARKRYAAALSGPRHEQAAMKLLLRADIFAVLMMQAMGLSDEARQLIRIRGERVLVADKQAPDPSLYALPVAFDTLRAVMPAVPRLPAKPDQAFLVDIMARADDVLRVIDASVIRDWFWFGQAAQDMAWRGTSKRTILGAAMTAESPRVRTFAMQIGENSRLPPYAPDAVMGHYSSFHDMDLNAKWHDLAVEQSFAAAMADDPIRKGSRVFINAAHRQMDAMRRGDVMGWCARALHETARAFDADERRDAHALARAREVFVTHKNSVKWEDLSALGEDIVARLRDGDGGLPDWSEIEQMAGQYGGVMGDIVQAAQLRALVDKEIIPTGPSLAPVFSAPSKSIAPAPVAAPQLAMSLGIGGTSSHTHMPAHQDITDETDRKS